MERVLLIIGIVIILFDAISNAFLIVYYPKWEQIKKQEMDQIREQNAELREYIKACLVTDDCK